MQTILVTGSNGLLGQKLTDLFRNNSKYRLIATSKGADRYPQKARYIYRELDITNREEIFSVLGQYRPDIIIHTAAMTNVDTCELEKENCRKLNVDAVHFFVQYLEENKQQDVQFIHLSTDFVFDGSSGPYKEEDLAHPLSYYGESKRDAEQILINSSCKNWVILRTIIVYGVAAEMSRNNIVLWAKSSLEKGEQMRVVEDQFRMPTLAEDLATACLLAVEKNAKGIYHISGKDFMSVYEMVKRIASFFKLNSDLITPINSSSLNQAAQRPPRTGFILDKAIKELGYNPHSFEEGLAIVQQQLRKV